ncbi:MAG: leucine-rich repeat domain-containing protein [Oribacterium sp.]|nr:leucine-rich repeat domain-containing protein [Oribacterium sp.]MBQ5330728.1 leucine-rich repeat domain-containing protein [Oscillospiraceae bacterium]
MQCESCHAEFESNLFSCPECGAPVLQTIAGFDSTKEIQRKMKHMHDEYGDELVIDRKKFISLIHDFLPEYEKERRLLIFVYKVGILRLMFKEGNKPGGNREIATMRAKSLLLSDLFLSEAASEFVVACYTYMLGWPFEAKLRVPERDGTEVEEEEEKQPRRPLNIDEMTFYPVDAFWYRLRPNVVLKDGYTKIESFSFDGFTGIRTVKLPDTLLAIGEYAFSGCKNLKGLELPETMKIIRQGAFSGCSSLSYVKIPKGILEIEDHTFEFCTSLETVEIPPSVGSIGSAAFSGCEKLKKLLMPDSIKFIDDDAFSYCPELVITCYENSYVHKYCIANGIEVETTQKGIELNKKRRL